MQLLGRELDCGGAEVFGKLGLGRNRHQRDDRRGRGKHPGQHDLTGGGAQFARDLVERDAAPGIVLGTDLLLHLFGIMIRATQQR